MFILWAICCVLLPQADEPAPVGNYNQRKEEEEKLLLKLSRQLQRLVLVLHQDNVTTNCAVWATWTNKYNLRLEKLLIHLVYYLHRVKKALLGLVFLMRPWRTHWHFLGVLVNGWILTWLWRGADATWSVRLGRKHHQDFGGFFRSGQSKTQQWKFCSWIKPLEISPYCKALQQFPEFYVTQ